LTALVGESKKNTIAGASERRKHTTRDRGVKGAVALAAPIGYWGGGGGGERGGAMLRIALARKSRRELRGKKKLRGGAGGTVPCD